MLYNRYELMLGAAAEIHYKHRPRRVEISLGKVVSLPHLLGAPRAAGYDSAPVSHPGRFCFTWCRLTCDRRDTFQPDLCVDRQPRRWVRMLSLQSPTPLVKRPEGQIRTDEGADNGTDASIYGRKGFQSV
jgi:hypothetical protein